MTTYTKEQIESGQLNAQELILSFSIGNNAATKNPSLLTGIHNGAVQGKPVSVAVLTAYAEFMASKSQELAEALQSGYIVPRHKLQYAVAQVEKPLEGHVMTSAQWLQSCIDMLPSIPAPDYEGSAALTNTITEAMTKAQIWTIVQEAQSLVNVKVYTIADCTPDQQDKYYDLLNKERAISSAIYALSVYLEGVEPMPKTDSMLRGKYPVLTGTMPLFKQLISEEKWELIGAPIASNDGEYMTFTIKVI